MPKPIMRHIGALGINQIDGVVRVSPRIDKIFARKNFAHIFRSSRVINDGIASVGKPDAYYQVAAGPRRSPPQSIVIN